MQVKTSVSLSAELLDEMNTIATSGERSGFIEKAVWNYIKSLKRAKRDQDDLKKLNASVSWLNDEAHDSLSYQDPL